MPYNSLCSRYVVGHIHKDCKVGANSSGVRTIEDWLEKEGTLAMEKVPMVAET